MAKRRNYTTYRQNQKRKQYGEQERHHLTTLISILQAQRPNYQFDLIPSPLNRAVPYDGLVHIKDENGFVVKKLIIEAKVRTADYPTYFLEKQKYDNLKKLQSAHNDYLIWYINFTPSGTHIFDLDSIDLGPVKKIEMNAQTFKSRSNKRTKAVFTLDIKESARINYQYNKNPYESI